MSAPEIYVVLDSRAQYDTDAAAVMECVGEKRPKMRRLSRDWGDQGAVLVRWYAPDAKGAFTKSEVVGVIP